MSRREFWNTPHGDGDVRGVCPMPMITEPMPLSDGMFTIMVPATVLPLVVTLVWAERKAKRLGLIPVKEQLSFAGRLRAFFQQLNVVGFVLLGTAVSLILLPLTLSQTAKSGWNNRMSILYSKYFHIDNFPSINHCHDRGRLCCLVPVHRMGQLFC